MEISTGPVTTPRPFGEIPSLWLKVFQMNDAFFAAEAPRARNGNTLLAVIILAVVTTIFGFLQEAIGSTNQLIQRFFGTNTPQPNIQGGYLVCGLLVALVLTPIGYYIGMGILHLGAVIFGGRGSYTTLAYLVSLFYVPLGIAGAVVALIPCLGALISLAIGIYSIVLTVRALKVNYQLTTGRAVGAYFLPTLVILLLFGICLVVVLVLLAPTMGNIFSNMIPNFRTPVP